MCPATTVARNVQRTSAGVDLAALEARQQSMWASDDFAVIGTTLHSVGESLCEALELEAGSRVLDVACVTAMRLWQRHSAGVE